MRDRTIGATCLRAVAYTLPELPPAPPTAAQPWSAVSRRGRRGDVAPLSEGGEGGRQGRGRAPNQNAPPLTYDVGPLLVPRSLCAGKHPSLQGGGTSVPRLRDAKLHRTPRFRHVRRRNHADLCLHLRFCGSSRDQERSCGMCHIFVVLDILSAAAPEISIMTVQCWQSMGAFSPSGEC